MQSFNNKKHLIKYEQNKLKQMLTQFFYFSTSVWFSQSATHISFSYDVMFLYAVCNCCCCIALTN